MKSRLLFALCLIAIVFTTSSCKRRKESCAAYNRVAIENTTEQTSHK